MPAHLVPSPARPAARRAAPALALVFLLGGIASAQTTVFELHGDGAGDEFGRWVAIVGDVNGDGVPDVAVGAPGDDDNGADAGSVRVLSGYSGTVLFQVDGRDAGDRAGRCVAAAGDFDDDGRADVVVGEPYAVLAGEQRGRVVVVSGLDQTKLASLSGDGDGDLFGLAVAGVGDVDMDGFDDVAVGAPFADDAGMDAGRVRVYSGFDQSVIHTFDGDTPVSYFGFSVAAAGDVDGDGYPDVVVGAPSYPGGAANGGVHVFSGFDGSELHGFVGDDPGDQLGYSVAGAGDVDDDGFDDVVAGADEDDTTGSKAGLARVWSGFDGSVLHTLVGGAAEDRFGRAVAGAGDVDMDGFDDFAVSALRTDALAMDAGSVTLFSGFDASVIFTVEGGGAGDELGAGLAGGADVNGDGVPDLCVGSARYDGNGSDAGGAWVVSGAEMRLAADRHEVSLLTGGTTVFALDAGAANAGSFYWILGSVTGKVPGQLVGGVLLPLNADPYFGLTLKNPFLGIFGAYIGLLDVHGEAGATFKIPAGVDPGLAGLLFHHAYIAAAVIGQVDLASNAVPVTLVD